MHPNGTEFWHFPTHYSKNHNISVPFVCTYFLSQNCVYWVYITHIIEYNVSAHLRHTFIASHNQKMGYFWKLGLFKAKIVNFEYPPLNFFGIWYVHMPFIYVNYLYLAHSEMISETKYVHPCGTHTSFSPKKIFWWNFFSVVGPVCAVWVHILCLIIHFLEVQIWFFICVKYQLAV